MFPYNFGANGGPGSFIAPFAFPLTNRGFYDGDLPDEVKEAIENRKNEIRTEEDVRRIADETMKRR